MAYTTRYTDPATWRFPGSYTFQWPQRPEPQQSPPAGPAGGGQQDQSVAPFDAALTEGLSVADLNYANTLAAIAAERPVIQREFGYTDSGEIDPNNPFSRAQLLQRSYQQTKRGTGNSYAARGQLYSGALQRAQNENQFRYQSQDSQLRGQLSQYLASLAGRAADAANVRNIQRSDSYMRWVMGQVADRNAPPVDPAPPPAPPLGGGPAEQSFASFQGTPVESYLRAMHEASRGARSAGSVVGGIVARR